jgi:hypothetical protein
MSTTPNDRCGRRFSTRHADYFIGRADELVEHDGFRLVPAGRPIPFEDTVALVATVVNELPNGAVYVEFTDRAAMVSDIADEALYGLPAAGEPKVRSRVLDPHEAVLIRG